jgi:hypothetical protein
VDADAIGHDLGWGTAAFTRSISIASLEPARPDGDAAAQAPSEPAGSSGSEWSTAAPGSGDLESAEASAALPF